MFNSFSIRIVTTIYYKLMNVVQKFIAIAIVLYFWGCSASVNETVKEKEVVKSSEVKSEIEFRNPETEERLHIKENQIKSIDKLEFQFDADGNTGSPLKLATLTYDENGFLSETINYNSDGSEENLFAYEYDSSGTRLSSKRYDLQNRLQKIFLYEYDKRGLKVRVNRTNVSGQIEKYYKYEYDKTGKLLKESWFNSDGSKEFEIEYSYNSSGQKIEANSFSFIGGDDYRYQLRYDVKGNLVEEIKQDDNGEKISVIQYIYKYYD